MDEDGTEKLAGRLRRTLSHEGEGLAMAMAAMVVLWFRGDVRQTGVAARAARCPMAWS